MNQDLIQALTTNQPLFGLELSSEAMIQLADFYTILLEHNTLLHLVAPCPPEEFATRHILESLTLLKHLPPRAKFVDVGSGGGLPAIPCLIVHDDLSALLIESKEKKAKFLELAIDRLGLADRAEVAAKQFAEIDPANAEYVTCRALDKFPDRVSKILKWSGRRGLLFFGGDQIAQALKANGANAAAEIMPLSDRRFLFAAKA